MLQDRRASSINAERPIRPYTGVGSRETPEAIKLKMRAIGEALAKAGFTLRSGGALGADMEFEVGARRVPGARLEIYLPKKGFEGNPSPLYGVDEAALALAATVHPMWELVVAKGYDKLHARNCYQVLGRKLNSPSLFLTCWTEDGCEGEATRSMRTGGTATAIVLARRSGVPVFNLAREGSPARLSDFLAKLGVPSIAGLATGDQPSLF